MCKKKRDNAKRLACVISRYSESTDTVAKLARILNYDPKQLQQDMHDIWEVVSDMPIEKEN